MRDSAYKVSDFSANMKTLMKERGVSAKQLCEDTGILYATFFKWMSASSMPSVSAVLTLAKYFNVSPYNLFDTKYTEPYQNELLQLQQQVNTLMQENQKLQIENALLKDCVKENSSCQVL